MCKIFFTKYFCTDLYRWLSGVLLWLLVYLWPLDSGICPELLNLLRGADFMRDPTLGNKLALTDLPSLYKS